MSHDRCVFFLKTTDMTIMSLRDDKSKVTMPLINMIILAYDQFPRYCMMNIKILDAKYWFELLSCICITCRPDSVGNYLIKHPSSNMLLTKFFKNTEQACIVHS